MVARQWQSAGHFTKVVILGRFSIGASECAVRRWALYEPGMKPISLVHPRDSNWWKLQLTVYCDVKTLKTTRRWGKYLPLTSFLLKSWWLTFRWFNLANLGPSNLPKCIFELIHHRLTFHNTELLLQITVSGFCIINTTQLTYLLLVMFTYIHKYIFKYYFWQFMITSYYIKNQTHSTLFYCHTSCYIINFVRFKLYRLIYYFFMLINCYKYLNYIGFAILWFDLKKTLIQ